MSCRDMYGTVLSSSFDPKGYCFDNTSSGTAPAKPDAGVGDGGTGDGSAGDGTVVSDGGAG